MIFAKVTGLASLAHNLSTIAKATKVAAATRSRSIADDMVTDMQARVAEDVGALRESIRAEDNDDGTVMVRAGGTPATTRETAGGTVDEAVLVEHGTVHMPARPFFWPVVEAARERHGADVIDAVDSTLGNA